MKTNTKQSIVALMLASSMAIPFVFAANEPENVNNVSAVSKDATTLTVSWDEAKDYQGSDVDHYRIYYGTQSVQGGDAPSYEVEVDTPDNATIYDLGDLSTDTTYYLSVTAIDALDVESLEYSIETSGIPTEEIVEPEGDTVPPTVVNVIAADKNHVLVGFSEEVVLPELLAEAAFTITEQINAINVLEVISAKKYEEDPENKTVLLETAEQTKNVNYIVTASVAITDLAGNPIVSGSTDSGIFLGSDLESSVVSEEDVMEEVVMEEEEEVVDEAEELLDTPLDEVAEEVDVMAPEDITNLVLSFTEQLEKFVISMSWTASLNTAKDLVDQILYMSMDRGISYDSGNSLGPLVTNHQVPNLEGGKEYTFKITTKDATGNESVGVVKSIRLPQTGFGAGLLVLASAAAAHRALRRKKKKDIF
jgi:hypothetical protein